MAQMQPRSHLEAPFSLIPAVFTEFSTVPTEAQPTGQEEKITRILKNLSLQHEAVRRNMVALLHVRKKELVRKAEKEITALSEHGDERESAAATNEQKGSLKTMSSNMRVKAKDGSKVEDFEVKVGGPEFKTMFPVSEGENGDVDMSGIQHRSVATIRQELSLALRDLVDRGVAELEAYDKHATESRNVYKQALKRHSERRGSSTTASVQSPVSNSGGRNAMSGAGILRNGYEQGGDFRRTSMGMPIPGLGQGAQPVRTFESVEEVARRGSSSK